jgi:hypothetical protein
MSNESAATNRLFHERKQFVILGLTGQTGSGCTTCSELLKSATWMDFNPPSDASFFQSDNDKRKYKILYEYLAENWVTFDVIKVKDLITAYLLINSYPEFREFLAKSCNADNDECLKPIDEEIRSIFLDLKEQMSDSHLTFLKTEKNESTIYSLENTELDALYTFFFSKIPRLSEQLTKTLPKINPSSYTALYQQFGDNIRSSGNPVNSNFNPDNIFAIAHSINKLIKLIKHRKKISNTNTNPCLIAIDT